MKPEVIDSRSATLSARASFDELGHRLEELEAVLRSQKLRVSGAARLPEYKRILRQASEAGDSIAESNPLMESVHRALLECREYLTIVTQLSRQPEVSGWRKGVQIALGGLALPSDEGSATPARDKQYELLLAASVRSVGYAIQLAEPDVVAQLDQAEFGIAAKRPKSENGLNKAARKGNQQIKKSGVVGILAVDFSLLCEVPHKRVLVPTAEEGRRHLYQLLDEEVDHRVAQLRCLV